MNKWLDGSRVKEGFVLRNKKIKCVLIGKKPIKLKRLKIQESMMP